MSATYDTGHAKNVANLSRFYQILDTFGTTYNPANINITMPALSALRANAEAKIAATNSSLTIWKNSTNQREIAFEELDKLSTKLLGALQSYSVPDQTLHDFTSLVKKIRGTGKLSKADAGKAGSGSGTSTTSDPAPPIDATISNSQQSFDNKIQHFSNMVLLLQTIATYVPNEADYTVASLTTRLNNLTLLNNAANTSSANLKASRIDRNTFLYSKGSGMLDTVKQSKAYVKSIYGTSSPQYHSVNAVKFFRVVPVTKAS